MLLIAFRRISSHFVAFGNALKCIENALGFCGFSARPIVTRRGNAGIAGYAPDLNVTVHAEETPIT